MFRTLCSKMKPVVLLVALILVVSGKSNTKAFEYIPNGNTAYTSKYII